ncbi:RepB family plasmid replication initiator protein, partial [Escherichia coli]|nr:RepB family plasmid replication initiator protein [Escherichia coli]
MDKSSGELVTLTPNNNNTVQPVALMRLGVFVPTLKSLKNSKKNTLSRTDATEELTRLSLARAEGFDKVEITGPRLVNRPGFPGEYFICELRLPDHYFRWKHNKLFLLLPEEYGPAFP